VAYESKVEIFQKENYTRVFFLSLFRTEEETGVEPGVLTSVLVRTVAMTT
jgi:hypothetical protein